MTYIILEKYKPYRQKSMSKGFFFGGGGLILNDAGIY